jgi:hypothetical protein
LGEKAGICGFWTSKYNLTDFGSFMEHELSNPTTLLETIWATDFLTNVETKT